MFRLSLITVAIFLISNAISQQNLMVNGGFEIFDPNGFHPDDDFSINYALGWQALNKTADWIHDSNSQGGTASHVPRNGDGNARFGYPTNEMQEYFYGQTNTLNVGETYNVSFWVRKDALNSENIPVGLHIGSNVPNPQQIDPYIETTVPQIRVTPTTTQYVKATFCYTAQSTGVHYVTIGTFGNNPTGENQLFLVDDVSVELIDNSSVYSNAGISGNQTLYCIGDNVELDGTSSTDDLEHKWGLYELINGNEELIYEQNIQGGQAGPITINAFFSLANVLPQPGSCYRAYLTTYNSCSSQDYIDFCYEDVDVDFLNNENAVCEGTPIDLEVTGDNNWTYEWSTGESGQGEDFKTIEVIPTGNSATYSVTVTTPNGCTVTESINFTVHSQNNQAPWMNGINGSGEYTLYVNTDPGPTDQISFTSDIFNDNANESFGIVSITENFPQGTFYNITPNGNSSISFNWNYGSGLVPDVPPGEYSFTVFLEDNNKCNKGENDFTFIIKLICENCPECITYEDRSSSTTPLPPETEAARCIKAGFSQTVDTENEDVYFQAGESIDLGPYFEAGPGYEGVIEPTTCVTDCEDCCINWEGFTYDDIAEGVHEEPDGGLFDVVFMDFLDNDPTNDIFQLTDVNNPYCAYNALGYDLSIIYGYDEVIYQKSFNADNCCNFVSPSPDNPIPHASIWWDGYVNQGSYFGDFPRVDELNLPSGLVRYEITLYGCDGATELIVGFINVNPNGSKMNTGDESSNGRMNETLQQSIERRIELEKAVKLSPNPTRSKVTISGVAATEISSIKIYDDKGIIVQYEKEVDSGQVSLENLKPGTYYCKIKVNGLNITKKFVKL